MSVICQVAPFPENSDTSNHTLKTQ